MEGGLGSGFRLQRYLSCYNNFLITVGAALHESKIKIVTAGEFM